MGCGASTKGVPPKEVVTAVDAELGTWATKTAIPSKDSSNTEVEVFTAPAKGASLVPSKPDKSAVIILDADEDEDGIEVIYEARPKWQQPEAANGQEPPEAAEELRRPEPKPLPKQQQEQAAKLAETRKRFDNDRYKKERSSSSSPSFDMPGMINAGPDVPARYSPIEAVALPKGPPAKEDVGKFSGPKTDLMLGLNVSQTSHKEAAVDPFGCVPGSIFDELEDLQQPIKETENRENQHDEVKTRREISGFDDEDEMMMKEILDNFEA